MESVFKYIFAMIVGAMFILFFVGFGKNIISSSEKMDAVVLVAGFDDYLFTLTANEMAKDDQNFGVQTALNFKEGTISSGKNKPTNTNRIVYAPKTLSGTKITTRAIRWAFPYDIDSFFYITNAKYKYVIVYDDSSKDFVNELAESINRTFEIRTYEKSKIASAAPALGRGWTDMSRVTFLMIGDSDISAADKTKIKTAIPKAKFVFAKGLGNEEEPENQWAYGSIEFDGEEGDSYYIGNAMLLGAMYAENKANYDFNFKRAMDRLAAVSMIYDGKIQKLSSAASGCNYNIMAGAFTSLANAAKEAKEGAMDAAKLNSMVSAVESMDETNSRGLDCTAVF
ncbi:MAG: hypothetical protein WC852_00615 [Candidatus Nanoarchaeia archaeon]|jgi:hypothetical protein